MNAHTKMIALALFGIALVACTTGPAATPTASPSQTPTSPPTASPAPTDAAAPAGLDGRTFLSVSITDGGEDRPLVDGTRISLSFDGANIGANAGCNQMSGAYSLDGDVIVVDTMVTTEMACDPALMDQDQSLADFLTSRPTFTLSGNDLVLTSGETVMTMLDEEEATPDQALVGTVWTLDSVIDGDAVSSVPMGVVATLEFADDGTVAIRPGCNTGSSDYTIDGNTITFGPIALTRMACDGAAGQVENAVLAVLGSGPLSLTIDGDRLTLQGPGNGLGYTAGA
jgi:heat shock protein HslJ